VTPLEMWAANVRKDEVLEEGGTGCPMGPEAIVGRHRLGHMATVMMSHVITLFIGAKGGQNKIGRGAGGRRDEMPKGARGNRDWNVGEDTW
jgi:hypothetical protein